MSGNGENGVDRATVLNYIDKVYASLNRAWILENRVTLTTVVLSLLLLTFSVGAVSTEGTFSLLGLTLEIPLTGLLVGGIVIVTSLVIFFYSLSVRTTSLQKEMQRLYKTINYEEEQDAMADPLTGPFQGKISASYFSVRCFPNELGQKPRLSRLMIGWSPYLCCS